MSRALFPTESSHRGMIALLEEIARSRIASFLAVLEEHRGRPALACSRSRGRGIPWPWTCPTPAAAWSNWPNGSTGSCSITVAGSTWPRIR